MERSGKQRRQPSGVAAGIAAATAHAYVLYPEGADAAGGAKVRIFVLAARAAGR